MDLLITNMQTYHYIILLIDGLDYVMFLCLSAELSF